MMIMDTNTNTIHCDATGITLKRRHRSGANNIVYIRLTDEAKLCLELIAERYSKQVGRKVTKAEAVEALVKKVA